MNSISFVLLFIFCVKINCQADERKADKKPHWGPGQNLDSGPGPSLSEWVQMVPQSGLSPPNSEPEGPWNQQNQWKPEPVGRPEHWKPQQEGKPEGRPKPEGKPEGRPKPEGKPEHWRPEPEGKPEHWRPEPEGKPGGQWGKPSKPEAEWIPVEITGPSKPEPGSEPELQWVRPGKPEPEPEPECRIIPKQSRTIEITPIAEAEASANSVYPCDSSSTIRQISYSRMSNSSLVTCNGIIVQKNDEYYDAIFGKSHHSEKLYLKNYTQIKSFNNGNMDYLECGTIVGGRCHGDTLWGMGIYAVDDQEGCVCDGMSAVVAMVRRVEIRGKCQSRCSSGSSILVFAEPINNRGQQNHHGKTDK